MKRTFRWSKFVRHKQVAIHIALAILLPRLVLCQDVQKQMPLDESVRKYLSTAEKIESLEYSATVTSTFGDEFLKEYGQINKADVPLVRLIHVKCDSDRYRIEMQGQQKAGQQDPGSFVETYDGHLRQTFDGRIKCLILSTKLTSPEGFFNAMEGFFRPMCFVNSTSSAYKTPPIFLKDLLLKNKESLVSKFIASQGVLQMPNYDVLAADGFKYSIAISPQSGFPGAYSVKDNDGHVIVEYKVKDSREFQGFTYPTASTMVMRDPKGLWLRTDEWHLLDAKFNAKLAPDAWSIDPTIADQIWDKDNNIWIKPH